MVEAWKKIAHANIVQLREVFLTKDFDDEQPCIFFRFIFRIHIFIKIFLAIVFVYDYIPCYETLQKRHFNSNNSLLKGWANPYNISGEDRPFSAGKGI